MLKLVSFAANSPPANAIYPSCNLVLKMNFALVLVISYTLSCQAVATFTVFHGSNATKLNSELSLSNKELLNYAAKTGESVHVNVTMPFQTVLAQHEVSVQLDCGPLLELGEEGVSVVWSKLTLNNAGEQMSVDYSERPWPSGISGESQQTQALQVDDSFEEIESGSGIEGIYTVNGTHNSVLNLYSSIIADAGRTVSSHGIFRCELCYESLVLDDVLHCPVHRNVTLFIVGRPPTIISGNGANGTAKVNKVGADFCLEPSGSSALSVLELRCDLTQHPTVPLPTVTWLHNGAVVYEGDDMNMDFFTQGINVLFAPGFIYPTPLSLNGDDSLTFNLHVVNLSSPLIDYPAITSSNIREALFSLVTGTWTCVQNNSYGIDNETSRITLCGGLSGTFSFEESRIVTEESAGHVEVCVQSTGTVSQFRVQSFDSSAQATTDYLPIDVVMSTTGFRKCFQVTLTDDNSAEPVEAFELYLDATSTPEDDVTFINRTLTIVITDDDHTATDDMSSCSLNEYLLVHEIEEEKERVVETISNLLPFDLPASNSSNPEATTEVYDQLAELFDEVPTTASRDRFTAAVDDIHTAYAAECGGTSSGIPETDVISSLATKFRELTKGLNSIRQEALDEARDIYGKFLCYQEKATGSGRRRKRADFIEPTDCALDDCPAVISEPCHFFACLEISVTKFIMGFGNSADNQPCIGFIVDTTGSMGEEIAAAKRIILQFIKSQADSTVCYLLVPFNDYGGSTDPSEHFGPITHAFTATEFRHLEGIKLAELQTFEAAVNALYAHSGGDYPEYAFSAMLAALNYSFIDEYGDEFIPMRYNSEMIVITDATSKLPDLRSTVIARAKAQGVSIHFIFGYVNSAFPHPRTQFTFVADETGGVVYDDPHTSWSILQFYDLVTESGRKKRSAASPAFATVSVSRFVYAFRVSILTSSSVYAINITLPDGSTETAIVEDDVMIYLKSNPIPGLYYFGIAGSSVVDILIHRDVSLDISLLYLDKNFTVSSLKPLAACTSGKLALTTSRISEISSLSLVVSSSESSKTIPLTKCSNAFTTDYNFTAGNYNYTIEGVDSVGVDFTYDLEKTAVVGHHPSGTYSLTSTNSSVLVIEISDSFNMNFELRSNDHIGTTNFTLSASVAGFSLTLNPMIVELQPMQARNFTLTGSVVSSSAGGGQTSSITVTASNGCTTLSATRQVTVKALATVAPSALPTNECGCLNGGTCTVNSRRGRVFRRCECPPSYGGATCELAL